MSKKRAFVRYSKQGKIVPGSLILTAGSHPNGPSTWKEVPADLCCGGGEFQPCSTPVVLNMSTINRQITYPFVKCNDNVLFQVNSGCGFPAEPTWELIIQLLNTGCGTWIGSWEYSNNTVTLNMNCQIAQCLCPDGILTILTPAEPPNINLLKTI